MLNHARLLLDGEARSQTLFTVGNEDLHYVVTRPRDNEYVLGIFNDSLKSAPFKITSNIGTIKSLAEVNLNDNLAELKSVLGGVAYAPPGLRDSPELPLNYGLSDASHIEGRDFRLFRLKVEERGVRPIPEIRYPERPTGRVLSVAGLENIRPYLQGISMFFSWFDGVKVDAESLLSLEDAWLVEQAHWLDRRGVRVVVDGTGVDEAKAEFVIDKLRLLKKAPKDLIVSHPSSALNASAERSGVRIVGFGSVKHLAKKRDRFNKRSTLNVIDLHYRNEEDLYHDLVRFSGGETTGELRGERDPMGMLSSPMASGGTNQHFLCVGPGLADLSVLLAHDREAFDKVAGVKIDSTYLLAKNIAVLAKDRATLAALGLRVVVDLRGDQMHFDRITFYPHIPNYETGMMLYGQIIDKMKAVGAEDLMMRIYDSGDMRGIDKYSEQRDKTWGEMVRLAAEKGINLHLICDPGIKFSPAAAFDSPNVFVIKGPKGQASPYRLFKLEDR